MDWSPTVSIRRRSNGEGSVRFNAARARWEGRVTVGLNESGAPRRKMVTATTKRDVLAAMRKLADDASNGIEAQRLTTTVAGMLARWLADVVPGTVAEPTRQQYADVVRLYVNPRIGHKRVRTLTPGDVTAMLRDMERSTPTRPSGYSATARRLARSVLRRALRWAEIEGYVARNAAALAQGVKADRTEARTMTAEQASTFLAAVKGDRNEALYVVALSLGLRVSELLAVAWDDVNLDGPAPSLTVRRGIKRIRTGKGNRSRKRGEAGGLIVGDVKTSSSRRTIDLPAVTVAVLREHRSRQVVERLAFPAEWPDRPLGLDLVFRTPMGTAMDPSNAAHALSKATKAAGLGHWHPHELRHSAASLMLAQGVPLRTISDVLGHSSIKVTSDVYSHLFAPARAEAAAAMNRALGGA
jgi:integrase